MDPGPLGRESTVGRTPFLSGVVCAYASVPAHTTTTATHEQTQRSQVTNDILPPRHTVPVITPPADPHPNYARNPNAATKSS